MTEAPKDSGTPDPPPPPYSSWSDYWADWAEEYDRDWEA